ncbi:MAG: hypothetical protein U9N35_08980 [Euryarchaeota archaeon]|nr:hypothetical protein [Euryarchaeota archaeon]
MNPEEIRRIIEGLKSEKKTIILTDFDTEGTELFKRYRKELETLGPPWIQDITEN